MFLGHFAVAFAVKPATPTVSLGTMFVACELVDVLWPIFVLLGIETVAVAPQATAFTPLEFLSYPWTHSLLMDVAWAAFLAVLYFLVRHDRRAAIIIGAVVLSHWFLDALVHKPDLPLWPGGETRIGLGLWNSVGGTLIVEIAMFVLGLALYVSCTRPTDRIGRFGFWGLVALLAASYAGAVFGPPPPSVQAMAWVSLAGAAVTGVLGYWVDAHRAMKR